MAGYYVGAAVQLRYVVESGPISRDELRWINRVIDYAKDLESVRQ